MTQPSILPCISTCLLQKLPFRQNIFLNIKVAKSWEKGRPVRKAKDPF